jgi:NAD(P)-dependent dehydrogenase (short-subunit alcohol dehydrogenase family)
MIARGRGRVITIASLASFVGLLEVAAYTAARRASRAHRALAVEWAPRGVTSTDRARRLSHGPQSRAARLAARPGVSAADADAPVWTGRGTRRRRRVSGVDAASFVTGQLIVVDGGFLASGVNQ